MAGKNIHSEEFDDGTQLKLEIFRQYMASAVPVYVQQTYWTDINICDFFAGPGEDIEGQPGSPQIIISTVLSETNYSNIVRMRKNVRILFNEFDKNKYIKLKQWVNSLPKKDFVEIVPYNLDFTEAFKIFLETYYKHNRSMNLLIMDQNGYKFLKSDLLQTLSCLEKTDWIFFAATSYLKRFGKNPSAHHFGSEFLKKMEELPQSQVHRHLADWIQEKVPLEVGISSFSIRKKHGAIYGVIFGSKNYKAIELFLNACWILDPVIGESNHDIDDDHIDFFEPSFFDETPKKLDLFKGRIENYILKGNIDNNKKLYIFTVRNGFLPKHAKKIFDDMVKAKQIKPCDPLNLGYELINGKKPIVPFVRI